MNEQRISIKSLSTVGQVIDLEEGQDLELDGRTVLVRWYSGAHQKIFLTDASSKGLDPSNPPDGTELYRDRFIHLREGRVAERHAKAIFSPQELLQVLKAGNYHFG